MPVVLDTDHLSVLQWEEQPACDRLRARLNHLPADDIATTIVSFQEQVVGWIAYLKRARKPAEIVRAYDRLESLRRGFVKMNVLSFTEATQEHFGELRRQCPRVQTIDLRIAAVAVTTGATLLTRNLRDFRQVPGLAVEDWTR